MKKTILIFAFLMASFVLFSQNNTVKEQNFTNNSIPQKDLLMQKQMNEMELQQEQNIEALLYKQSQQQNNNVKANAQDSLALVALYDSTDGANWTHTWDMNQPVSTWDGITLDANGRVKSISLYGNQLTGSIPPEIGNLDSLQFLGLDHNQLSGSIPHEIGNLTNLQSLYLNNNQLSDSIPHEIGNLDSLQYLVLHYNQLSGSIPPEIGNLTNLLHLYLNINQLTGSIPTEIGNLLNLQRLFLNNNQLSGSIPSEIGNLLNLQILFLSYNQLSDSIPHEIGNLTNVQSFYLDHNQLSGSMPPEIGNLTNVQSFFLYHNQLSGSIPSEIGNLTNLQYLNLSDNQLSDSIPSEIVNLSNLKWLNLSNNQLTGSIPSEIDSLSNLQYFILSNNLLSGSIPTEIGNLTNLQSISLSYNQLTGSIPPEIGNLTIQSLTLGNNQLSGSIPTEIGNLTNLQTLVLENNQLSGSIPTEIGNLSNFQTLYLNNNQLSGAIPEGIDSLSNLQYLYLENNNFDDLPDISSLTNLNYLQVYNNKLTFEDIEPNISISGFYYWPQAKVGSVQYYTPNIGDNLTLYVTVGGTANTYQWYKDNNIISSATNSSYTISNYNPAVDSAVYYCKIKNTIATDLTLQSENIYVGYAIPQYQISASVYPVNSGTVTGDSTYDYGTTATLIATPNTGYHFLNWTQNGNEVSTNFEYSFTVTQDSSFIANFKAYTYTISASVNPANSGTVSGDSTYDYGSTATLIATPNTNYHFANWTQNGNEVSTNPEFSFTVTQDSSFVANFVLDTYTISASVNPANSGTVSGDSTYDYGTTATLIATPNEGYHFLNWTQDGNEVSTNPEFSFTVTQDSSFVANFMLDTYTISASVNPANSGTVSGDSTYDYGTNATLIATPNEGYHFVNWTQNGNEVSTNLGFSFTVTQDSSFVANFEINTYIISATVNPANSGTVSGDSTYDYGTNATLIATPNEGYNFVNWTQNGNEVSTNPEFSFTVTQDSSFVANFEINTYIISATVNPANSGTISGDSTYEYGTNATLVATPNEGYHFVNWTQNGNEISTNPEFSFTVTQDSSFVANFEINTYIISATVNPANTGTVSGDSTYEYGTTATLIATPNTGYHFLNWTQDGNEVSTDSIFTFTVTQDSSFVANFEANPSSVMENSNSNISIYPNPANDKVNIISNDIYEISLYDISGKLISIDNSVSRTKELNVSTLKSGIYIIKLSNSESTYVYKIIKE